MNLYISNLGWSGPGLAYLGHVAHWVSPAFIHMTAGLYKQYAGGLM